MRIHVGNSDCTSPTWALRSHAEDREERELQLVLKWFKCRNRNPEGGGPEVPEGD
jgi:hypothetical protein